MEDLPPPTLESFRRVIASEAHALNVLNIKTRSHLKQKKDELDHVKIILRSGGQPFPFQPGNDAKSQTTQRSQTTQTTQTPQTPQKPQSPPKPQFLVALAHHQPTDIFLLFCFSPTILPCRLVRFNRDGKLVTCEGNIIQQRRFETFSRHLKPSPVIEGREGRAESEKSETDKTDNATGVWSKEDASVLVAAVNRCQKEARGYFYDGDKDVDDGNAEDGDVEMAENGDGDGVGDGVDDGDDEGPEAREIDHSKCLSLVSEMEKEQAETTDEGESNHVNNQSNDNAEEMKSNNQNDKKEDIYAIRNLILNDLLHSRRVGGSHGINGFDQSNGAYGTEEEIVFHHPDPKYLLPLCQAIVDELFEWRKMCRLARSLWSDLKLTSAGNVGEEENSKHGENSEKDENGGNGRNGRNGKGLVQFEEGTHERKKLDEITSRRNGDQNAIVEYCKETLETMKGHLEEYLATLERSCKLSSSLCNEGEQCNNDGAAEKGRKEHSKLKDMTEVKNRRGAKDDEMKGDDTEDGAQKLVGVSNETGQGGRNIDLKHDRSLLRLIAQITKEQVASLATLESIQKENKSKWDNLHEEFGYAINFHQALTKKESCVLKPWLRRHRKKMEDETNEEASEQDSDETSNFSEVEAVDGDDQGPSNKGRSKDQTLSDELHDLAMLILKSWEKEDRHLLRMLSNALSPIEECVLSGDVHRIKEIISSLSAVGPRMDKAIEMARKSTLVRATRLVELWNTDEDEDEDDSVEEDEDECEDNTRGQTWERTLTNKMWTEEESDAFMSFGQINEGGIAKPLHFVLDHGGLLIRSHSCFHDSVSHWEYPHGDYYNYRWDHECPYSSFDESWKKFATPLLDAFDEAIKRYLRERDLFNASILIICCARVLCNKVTSAKILDRYSINKSYLLENIQKRMEKIDIFAIKAALAFVDESNGCSGAEASWFDGFLRSGVVYFPTFEKGKTLPFKVYCHAASSIFVHNGWDHPTLSKALKGDESAIKQWTQMEAPDVIKERFFAMKGKNRASALSLANMLQGDPDTLNFLLENGCVTAAIEQSSVSQNVEGLVHLGKYLIETNPLTSLQCLQASLDLAVKKNRSVVPAEAIDNVIDLFLSPLLKPDAREVQTAVSPNRKTAPSLQIISTMIFCRSALVAAGSESGLRRLLEKKKIALSGVCLATIAIAIIVRSTGSSMKQIESIRYLLKKSGLYYSFMDKKIPTYSGLLTILDSVPDSCGIKNMLDICCAIWETSKFLMKEGCKSTFCFDMGLFTAMKIAALSGCESFAIDLLLSMKDMTKDSFEKYHPSLPSPLNALTKCYSNAFCSNTLRGNSNLLKMLLETFFERRLYCCRLSNHDSNRARTWAAVAMMQHEHLGKAVTNLVDHIVLNFKEGNKDRSLDEQFVNVFNKLSSIDKEGTSDSASSHRTGHTMSSFASSPLRIAITEKQRSQVCSHFVCDIFKSAKLRPSIVSKCARIDRLIHPSFWALQADQVEKRLASLEGLHSYLSEKDSLRHTCILLYFVDFSIMQNQTWCTSYFILVCGLSWMRKVLVSNEKLIQFDAADSLNSGKVDDFKEDWRSVFDQRDWTFGHFFDANHHLDNQPRFQALALAAVLRANAQAVEQSAPYLSDFCQEALTLCLVMECLAEPTPQRIQTYIERVAARGGEMQLPSHLQPCNVITFLMNEEWSSKPDYEIKLEKHHLKNEPTIPSFLPRVRIAVEHGNLEEGAKLCVTAGEVDGFWDSVFRNHLNDLESKRVREVLHGCLLLLEETASAGNEVPQRFMDIALQLILSMNWFGCCHRCSDFREEEGKNATGLVPSEGNLAVLQKIAFKWCELRNRERLGASGKLNFCLSIVCCLSQCCTWLRDQKSYRECDFCTFKDEHQQDLWHQEESTKTKKRKLQSSNDGRAQIIELERYAMHFGLMQQTKWCKFILQEYCTQTNDLQSNKQSKS